MSRPEKSWVFSDLYTSLNFEHDHHSNHLLSMHRWWWWGVLERSTVWWSSFLVRTTGTPCPLCLSQEYRWWWLWQWSWLWWQCKKVKDENCHETKNWYLVPHIFPSQEYRWWWGQRSWWRRWRDDKHMIKTEMILIIQSYIIRMHTQWRDKFTVAFYLQLLLKPKCVENQFFCSTVAQRSLSTDGQESLSLEESMATSSILQGELYYKKWEWSYVTVTVLKCRCFRVQSERSKFGYTSKI